MHLKVLYNMETQVFFVIKDLTVHDGFWAQSVRNSTLRLEEIEQFYCLEHNVYSQQIGDFLKWKAMLSCSKPFVHRPYFLFYLRDMFVGTFHIIHGTTR